MFKLWSRITKTEKREAQKLSLLLIYLLRSNNVTESMNAEEDFGFNKPQEESKYEEDAISHQKQIEEISEAKEDESELYDDDQVKKSRYQNIIVLCFWLSIHVGCLKIVNMLLDQDPLIQKLVASIFMNGHILTNKTQAQYEDRKLIKQIKTNSPLK